MSFKFVKFRGKVDKRKRIQIPARLETFPAGSKVLVTLEEIPEKSSEKTKKEE